MKPNKKTFIYIGFLFVLSLALYGHIYSQYGTVDIKDIVFWGALAIIVESLLVLLPNSDVGISVGSAINIAAILVGGPFLGTTIAMMGFLLRCPNIPGLGYKHLFNTPYYKTIFNIAQGSIISSIMGFVYIYAGGLVGQFNLLLTLLILFVGSLVNTLIISILISITNKQKLISLWLENMKGTILSSIAVGTLGIIIALAHIAYGYGAVLLFFGPLLLARHSFKLYIGMKNMYISTIETLNKVVEAKDPYTSGHANRVEEYSIKLAEAYGLTYEKIQNIKKASILHDIGKIAINDNILNKVSKLTEEEIAQIRLHPSVGADILSKMDFLGEVSRIIRYHHERYDGKGYPEKLSGEGIPLEACILAIADSYDAMTTDRPYKNAMTKKEALDEIKNNAGSQFHPELSELFISIMS